MILVALMLSGIVGKAQHYYVILMNRYTESGMMLMQKGPIINNGDEFKTFGKGQKKGQWNVDKLSNGSWMIYKIYDGRKFGLDCAGPGEIRTHLWDYNEGNPNQWFIIEKMATGYYAIKTRYGCLGYSGAANANNGYILSGGFNGGIHQQWYFLDAETGNPIDIK